MGDRVLCLACQIYFFKMLWYDEDLVYYTTKVLLLILSSFNIFMIILRINPNTYTINSRTL